MMHLSHMIYLEYYEEEIRRITEEKNAAEGTYVRYERGVRNVAVISYA